MSRITRTTRPTGFTQTELLAVITLLSLAVGLLIIAMPRRQAEHRRPVCASNLGSLGRAVAVYAAQYRDVLPTAAHDPAGADGATKIGNNAFAPDMAEGMNDESNTRGWFKLRKGGRNAPATGELFICPSAAGRLGHNKDGAKVRYDGADGQAASTVPVFDWRTDSQDGTSRIEYKAGSGFVEATELSYSFQVTLRSTSGGTPRGRIIKQTDDPRMAVGADRNPYSNCFNPATGAYGFKPGASIRGMEAPPERLTEFLAACNGDGQLRKRVNSRNHKQEGQNVVYLDGHAKWSNHPRAGADGDILWAPLTVREGSGNLKASIDVPQSGEAYGKMKPSPRLETDSLLLP